MNKHDNFKIKSVEAYNLVRLSRQVDGLSGVSMEDAANIIIDLRNRLINSATDELKEHVCIESYRLLIKAKLSNPAVTIADNYEKAGQIITSLGNQLIVERMLESAPSGKLYARIKVGSHISHDYGYTKWPRCKPPKSEYPNKESYEYITIKPSRIFEVEWKGSYWNCVADGYGILSADGGEYGNGSIYVTNPDGVEFVETDN